MLASVSMRNGSPSPTVSDAIVRLFPILARFITPLSLRRRRLSCIHLVRAAVSSGVQEDGTPGDGAGCNRSDVDRPGAATGGANDDRRQIHQCR